MPTARFEPSSIKNKLKREEVARKFKKAKSQTKLQKRLSRAKLEANDPAAKKVREIRGQAIRAQAIAFSNRNGSPKMCPERLIILENSILHS